MSLYTPPGPRTMAIFAGDVVPTGFIQITTPEPCKGFRFDPGLGTGPSPPSLPPRSKEIVLYFFPRNLRRVPPPFGRRVGKLRVLSGRDVCRIMEQHGFREVRRRGSHILMQRPDQAPSSSPYGM